MLLRRGAELEVEAKTRLLLQGAAPGAAIEDEGVQHDVVKEAAGFDSEARESEQGGLHVAGDLHGAGVCEPGRKGGEMLGVHGARFTGTPCETDGVEGE